MTVGKNMRWFLAHKYFIRCIVDLDWVIWGILSLKVISSQIFGFQLPVSIITHIFCKGRSLETLDEGTSQVDYRIVVMKWAVEFCLTRKTVEEFVLCVKKGEDKSRSTKTLLITILRVFIEIGVVYLWVDMQLLCNEIIIPLMP